MDSFVESTIESLRAKIGNGKVLCALSGGVDSSVAAVLLSKAVGKQLTCVFVDHGLLRKNEGGSRSAASSMNGKRKTLSQLPTDTSRFLTEITWKNCCLLFILGLNLFCQII